MDAWLQDRDGVGGVVHGCDVGGVVTALRLFVYVGGGFAALSCAVYYGGRWLDDKVRRLNVW